ncbi:hypothetical protein ACOMHN_057143 [Nucella lapillus]
MESNPVCLSMVRTGSTHNVPYLYFLVSAITSALALYYGILVSNSAFILINVVGLVLWGLYIVVYIGVSKSKSKAMSQLMISMVAVAAHGVYLKLMTPSHPAMVNNLGLFLSVWTIVLTLTPVLDIVEIIQQGTSAGSDLFLLLGGTLCCAAWLVYGYLLQDIFIYGPNVLGIAVNGAKLVTIAAYNSTTATKVKAQ